MDPRTQHRIFLIGERIWLAGAVIGVAGVIYFIVTGDNDSALYFLGFFVISGLFHILRKSQRKRLRGLSDEPGDKSQGPGRK
jgi:hypothetical protein